MDFKHKDQEANQPNIPQHSYFLLIPAHIADDPDLDDSTKLFFGRIAALSNKEGYCWASDDYLADLCKCKSRVITDRLDALEKKGYIQRDTKKRGMFWDRKIYPIYDIQKSFTKGATVPFREAHPCPFEGRPRAPEQDKCYIAKKNNKQTAASPDVVVFSCLKNLALEQKALYTLMQFPEERVELAVKFLQSQKKPPNNAAGLLIWHCQQVTPPPCGESKEEIIKKNRDWAKKREEEWLKNRTGCRIDALKDCCQIVIGGQKGTVDFSYSDADMIEKLKEELKKRE